MLEAEPKAYEDRATIRGVQPGANEYLTTAEAAAFLRVKPKSLRNKVRAGLFREGEHFYRRAGLGPRWKRTALVRWLETTEAADAEQFDLAQPGGRNVA